MNNRKMVTLGMLGRRNRLDFSPSVQTTIKLRADFSDISTLYKDAECTIPVTNIYDTIGGAINKSGNGNHLTMDTASLRPYYFYPVKNGKSLAYFRNQKLTNPSFSISQSDTIYIVVYVNGGANIYQVLLDGSTNRQLIYKDVGSGKLGYFAGSSLVVGNNSVDGKFALITATFSGATSKLYNKATLEASGNPGTSALTGIVVGNGKDVDLEMIGFVGELIIATQPSDEIYNYLYNKWGMATDTWDALATGTTDDVGNVGDASISDVIVRDGALFFNGLIGEFSKENLLSAGMIAKFDGNNFTCVVRSKVGAGLWADKIQRDLFRFDGGTGTNIFAIDKPVNTSTLRAFYTCGSDPDRHISTGNLSIIDWFTAGMKVDNSANIFKFFFNGVDQGAHDGGAIFAPFVNPLSRAEVGYTTNKGETAGYNWWGWIGDVVVGYATASDSDMVTLNTKLLAETLTASDLDAIFGVQNWSWFKNDAIL